MEMSRDVKPVSVKEMMAAAFKWSAIAMAAFQAEAYTFTESPWDRYLRGDDAAMATEAKQGALLFFGRAGCGECHTGRLLTDQDYHTMAAPQVGPGREPHSPRDFGNAAAGGGAGERYAFRTPPLLNVTLTGPWTHAGAYDDLEDVVRELVAEVIPILEAVESYPIVDHKGCGPMFLSETNCTKDLHRYALIIEKIADDLGAK